MKYRIRFNKSRGQPGRGTREHVWRVFDENGKEIICKNIQILTNSWGEKEEGSEDWNVCCRGHIEINRETSTVIVRPL